MWPDLFYNGAIMMRERPVCDIFSDRFIWACFFSLGSYLACSIFILNNGMLHEDAYILFKYVNNLVNFGEISYVHQLGPAEGATDFLWFILLSGVVYFGVLPGVAAVMLSLIGLFLIIYSGEKLLKFLHDDVSDKYKIGFYIFVVGVTFSTISAAALGGFSTLFYCGFVALGFQLSFRGLVRETIWTGLLLGLIRPDGLIISFGLFIVAMLVKVKNPKFLVANILGATIVGLIYFVWRWEYFDLPLPLPLMVKSHTAETFDGIHDVFTVFKYTAPILICYYYYFLVSNNKKYLLSLVPVVIFMAPLIFVHLSQNIAFRFQAPVFVISWMLFLVLFSRRSLARKSILYIAIAPLAFFGAKNFIQQFERLTKFEYINTLSPVIARSLSNHSIALTEAGRLPYFSNAVFYDLVGLNNKQAATQYVDSNMLLSWDPDLIFVHPINAISVKSKCEGGYERLSANDMVPNSSIRGNQDKATQAAFAAYDFVMSSKKYEFYAARFDRGCNHFYFIKKKSDLIYNFEAAIKYSIDPANKINYFSSESYNMSRLK